MPALPVEVTGVDTVVVAPVLPVEAAVTGTVVAAHPHNVEVRVLVDGGEQHRHYAHESVRRSPTLDEASNFIDH